MSAPQTFTRATRANPVLLWCESCAEHVEPYTMTVEDMHDRGAVGMVQDALTGVWWVRLGGKLVATDTELCGGCDAVLAPFAFEAARAGEMDRG